MSSYIKKSILLILDIVLVTIALLFSYLVRFDGFPGQYIEQFKDVVVFVVSIYVFDCWAFGLYKKMWRYASIRELLSIFWSTTLSAVLTYILFWGMNIRIPRSVLLLTWLFSILFIFPPS